MVGHTESVEVAVLGQRDGQPVAITASLEGVVIAWDLRTGNQLGPSLICDTRIQDITMAIGPLGVDTAVITVGDKQVRLWSLTTFHQLGDALNGRGRSTFCLATGAIDGWQILITAGADGTVRVLDLLTGQLSGPVLNGHKIYIGGAGFTESDRPVAVTAGQHDGVIRVWDLNKWRQHAPWPYAQGGRIAYADIRLLATSRRNGDPIIAVSSGASVQIWSLTSQTLLVELTGHTGMIKSVYISELDGTPMLLTASVDSTARIWNLDTFEPIAAPLTGHEGTVFGVALSTSGSDPLVFTGDNAGIVRAWCPTTGEEAGVAIPRLQKWISCLTAGQLYGQPVLLIGGGDGSVRVWCRTTSRVVAEAQLNTTPRDIVVHPPEDVCVATSMGVVALHIRNWMDGSAE